ncbi:YebG family protein [Rheinheimera sp.]|uniref:YebG family protein n=1 Tax=Rheinheimera sp. TaxID=1869214 RepID=UPI003AF9DBCB
MPVITKYIVERNGVEKMTFSSKTEADAYDRMLDLADELFVVLGQSQLFTDERQQDDLALYLAKNKDGLLACLNQKTKAAKEKPASKAADAEKAKDKLAVVAADADEAQAA